LLAARYVVLGTLAVNRAARYGQPRQAGSRGARGHRERQRRRAASRPCRVAVSSHAASSRATHCEPRCALRAAPGQRAGTPRHARGGAALRASQQGRAGGRGPCHAAGARKLRTQAEPGTPKAGRTSSRGRAAEPTAPGSREWAAPGVRTRASASSRPRHAANVKKMRTQGAVRRVGTGTPGIAR
jgi:hypothetical protein